MGNHMGKINFQRFRKQRKLKILNFKGHFGNLNFSGGENSRDRVRI